MKKINFKNIINNFKNSKSKRYYLVVSLATLLLLVGGSYAYFRILTSSGGINALISGKLSKIGNPTMVMKTSNLYLNVNASMMSEDNIGMEYLATTSSDELAYGVSDSDTTVLYNNYFDAVLAYCESVGDETCSEKQKETVNELYPDGITSALTNDEEFSLFKLLQEKLSMVADVPDDVKTTREAVNKAENALKKISNHIYTLATVSLPDGDETLNCTYKFKVTASVKNEISDDSDQDVYVSIGQNHIGYYNEDYDNFVSDGTTLGDAVTVGEDGVIVSGTITGLSPGSEKNIEILASLYNTENTQDDLADNSYTINIEPVKFECYLPDARNNVDGHTDFGEVSLSSKTDTSGESEINYLVSSISSDTELYNMKYCINTEESIKNCEWVNINSYYYSSDTKKYSQSIHYKLTEYDKYYFHLMNADGYVITSSYDYYKTATIALSAEDSILTAVLTKGTYNLNKYCINESSTSDNCEWNKISKTSITYTMSSRGPYYVHVIDDAGYVAHSSPAYRWDSNLTLAKNLITYRDLWQSGLEGDGYRFTGSGTATASTSPKNFICFGTTDKSTCTSNPSTYMYRIIGVFADENGDNHVKLIKYTQLSKAYAWNSSNTNVDWANSSLYAGLNGSYFLTNTTYSYMQDATWLNKITDWKWSAVNTKTYDGSSGPNYFDSLSPSNIYLHEMNRTGKTSTIGEWTTSTAKAKVGLMYASDYALSLGSTALTMTTGTYTNRTTLLTGWLHQSNNDTTASTVEWTISRVGAYGSTFYAWSVDLGGSINRSFYVTGARGASPVLYLESDVVGSGEGTLSDPYILEN